MIIKYQPELLSDHAQSAGFFQPIQLRYMPYIDIIDIDGRSVEGSDTKMESRTAAVQRVQDGDLKGI